MVTLSFNHIQGKNGSYWNRLMREEKAKEYCIVAIDAAKFVNTAMVCTIYGDILQAPFEFDGSMTGYQLMKKHIDATCEAYSHGENKVIKILDQFVSKSSLFLMRHYPHPSDILTLGKVGLTEISIKNNLKLRGHVIERLLDYAENSISKPKSMLESELTLLKLKLDEYELIHRQIKELEDVIEKKLLETDGGILLTIPGLGVTTAAELTAEIGNVHDFSHAGQLIKMAGTNPIVRQSGGKKANHYRISKQGRATFRNAVYQVGKNVSVQNPEMKMHYLAMKDKGKKAG